MGKVNTRSYQWTSPPAVAFTAFADVRPRATGNGDRRRPMHHWRGRNFDFFDKLFVSCCANFVFSGISSNELELPCRILKGVVFKIVF